MPAPFPGTWDHKTSIPQASRGLPAPLARHLGTEFEIPPSQNLSHMYTQSSTSILSWCPRRPNLVKAVFADLVPHNATSRNSPLWTSPVLGNASQGQLVLCHITKRALLFSPVPLRPLKPRCALLSTPAPRCKAQRFPLPPPQPCPPSIEDLHSPLAVPHLYCENQWARRRWRQQRPERAGKRCYEALIHRA